MKMRGVVTAVLVAVLALSAVPAMAWELRISEWGISGQYQVGANEAPKGTKGAGVLAHVALPLISEGQAELQLRLEGSVTGFYDYENASEVALAPALRALIKLGQFQPFIEGGIGGSYSTFEKRDLGSDFNFLLFAGGGVRWQPSSAFAVDLGYRYRHLSNAELGDVNPGLNTHQFLVGIVFPF